MKFFVIPALDLINIFGLTQHLEKLHTYLDGGRQDILAHMMFFEDNCCSKGRNGDFSMFRRASSIDDADVVVIGLYLELLEYWRERKTLVDMLNWVSKIIYPKKAIGYWNHDTDFSGANDYVPSNVFIINNGYTSNPGKNDILIPFWNIEKNPHSLPKTEFASFIGTPNNSLRQKLALSIRAYNHPEIQHKQIYGDEYLQELNRTVFVLCPRGGPGSGGFSYRVFEAFAAGSIPVIMVDILHFPMKDSIPWEKICVQIPEETASDIEKIHTTLKAIDIAQMLRAIEETKPLLTFGSIQKYIHDSIQTLTLTNAINV